MSMVNLTIDGKTVTVPAGTSILEAAKAANIRIPTFATSPRSRPLVPAGSAWWRLKETGAFRPPASSRWRRG